MGAIPCGCNSTSTANTVYPDFLRHCSNKTCAGRYLILYKLCPMNKTYLTT